MKLVIKAGISGVVKNRQFVSIYDLPVNWLGKDYYIINGRACDLENYFFRK